MWYSTGTITVASGGATATGTGTQFLGNVRVGDGIAIQGSASLHEVTGVTSNTQLSFSPPYAGTAGSGKAYRAVPVLGYDKDLSDAFNQLRLQFGDQLSNLQPWATAPTLSQAYDEFGLSASGRTVAAGTPAQGRTALEIPAAIESGVRALAVGTVSQSAGVPTGAIIERGSNANGEYVKFADGTQETWRTVPANSATSFGSGTADDPYRSSISSFNFPANFVEAPAVTAGAYRNTIDTGVDRICYAAWDGVTTSAVTGLQAVAVTNQEAPLLTIHAIGRWY